MMCLGAHLFVFNLLGVSWVSWMFKDFHQSSKLFGYYFSSVFSAPFSLSYPLGPTVHVGVLEVVPWVSEALFVFRQCFISFCSSYWSFALLYKFTDSPAVSNLPLVLLHDFSSSLRLFTCWLIIVLLPFNSLIIFLIAALKSFTTKSNFWRPLKAAHPQILVTFSCFFAFLIIFLLVLKTDHFRLYPVAALNFDFLQKVVAMFCLLICLFV